MPFLCKDQTENTWHLKGRVWVVKKETKKEEENDRQKDSERDTQTERQRERA